MGLVQIGWVGPKVNGFGPNRFRGEHTVERFGFGFFVRIFVQPIIC